MGAQQALNCHKQLPIDEEAFSVTDSDDRVSIIKSLLPIKFILHSNIADDEL